MTSMSAPVAFQRARNLWPDRQVLATTFGHGDTYQCKVGYFSPSGQIRAFYAPTFEEALEQARQAEANQA